MQAVALLLLVACGGHAPPPKPPPPPELTPQQLAHDIDDDLTQLARIAHDNRGNCTATVSQIQAHIPRMNLHHDQAMQLAKDPAKRQQLVTEMEAIGKQTTGRGAVVGEDLAFTHRACSEGCTPGAQCPASYQLERVIGDIPVY